MFCSKLLFLNVNGVEGGLFNLLEVTSYKLSQIFIFDFISSEFDNYSSHVGTTENFRKSWFFGNV